MASGIQASPHKRESVIMPFAENPIASEWIDQFDDSDRDDAKALLNSMLLVSADALFAGLRSLIVSLAKSGGPLGLYAERRVIRYRGRPVALFKEHLAKNGRLRAAGKGPSAVDASDPDIGSEGVISTLITGLCRENPSMFLSHPGPDEIRSQRVRRFVIVADFVGSGKRATTYLDAAWRVRSVRSWHSGKKLSFDVVAYSATTGGRKSVLEHASTPTLHILHPCPTIHSEFERTIDRMTSLCMRYDPRGPDPERSLGYNGAGTLIAFAHGCPNNAPRMLYTPGAAWKPLFPGRATGAAASSGFTRSNALSDPITALTRMGAQRLASSAWLSRLTENGLAMLVLLAALRRRPRDEVALASRTGLSIIEVRANLALAQNFQWIDAKNRLTDAGHAELLQAAKQNFPQPLPVATNKLYVPSSLRMPNI
ncbi:phosphoribosyltransferase-like protein [Bradyrhizobium sp. DASA03068]|uniref:phosphoribosyltransferase-like protein n=1 Tax=Bradyrhizobium sp. BLXBL-01 TaxID=3395915 RepID=UPI003F6ED543